MITPLCILVISLGFYGSRKLWENKRFPLLRKLGQLWNFHKISCNKKTSMKTELASEFPVSKNLWEIKKNFSILWSKKGWRIFILAENFLHREMLVKWIISSQFLTSKNAQKPWFFPQDFLSWEIVNKLHISFSFLGSINAGIIRHLTLQTSQNFLIQKMLQKVLKICVIMPAFFDPGNGGKIWDLFKKF